jgi:outer membrane protein assembly factor BamB
MTTVFDSTSLNDASHLKQSQNGRPRRLSILLWLSLVALLSIPFARSYFFEIDHQFANLAGLGLGFLAGLLGYLGIWLTIARNWVHHLLFLLMPLVPALLGFACLDYVGVTGETLPVFRLKSWSPRIASQPFGSESIQSKEPRILSEDGNSPLGRFESTQFLGNHRDGVTSSAEFDTNWEKRTPRTVWSQTIGAGWSSFAVSRGLAITLEQIDARECVTALEITTGNVVWRATFPGKHFQALGGLGPRSTPTIYAGKVFAQTAKGIVVCIELDSGAILWQQDLLQIANIDQDTSEKSITWGRSGSPLVFDNQVVVPLGGKSGDPKLKSLISFQIETGEIIWTGGSSQISYASPNLQTLCGVRQIVSVNEGCATGHNPANGDQLWSTAWPSKSNGDACASQPVSIGDRRVLLGKGYALGSKVVELESASSSDNPYNPSSWKVRDVWSNPRMLKTKFTSAIHYQDFVYGLSDGVLECVNPIDGVRVWRGSRYGQGQAIIVDGYILVTTEDGRIALVKADPTGDGKSIAELQVLDGITWNVPTVAGPYLLVRNGERVACLISEKDSQGDVQSASP